MGQGGMPPSGDDMVKGFIMPKPPNPTGQSQRGKPIIERPMSAPTEMASNAIPPTVYQQLLQMMKGKA